MPEKPMGGMNPVNVARWRRLAWSLYPLIARAVQKVPGFSLALSKLGIGRRVDALLRRLMLARLPNPIVTNDLTLYYTSKESMVPELAVGTYESETQSLFRSLLTPGAAMVDVGANLGFFSLLGSQCVGPSGRVYAFEPNPDVYALLVKNVEVNGFQNIVRTFKKAVSNEEGFRTVFLGHVGSEFSSFFETAGTGSESIIVETVTLDDFFRAEGWPAVHLIKMDIEGGEKLALEGMRELVSSNPGLKLVIELAPAFQRAAGFSPEELFETLLTLGFRSFWEVRDALSPLSVPQDVQRLVRVVGDGYRNLLCEA